MKPEDIKYWVWISSIPKIGPVKRKQLINHFGTPENIWNATDTDFKSVNFLTHSYINQIRDNKFKDRVESYIDTINKYDIKAITINDDTYPVYLKEIYDPPIVLFVRGNLRKDEKSIAIVGSRKATSYGLKIAETIGSELARHNITVVSGMARGIDTYAHEGALKSAGRTIAVLGCGPDVVYPPENKTLMKEIIDSGAVISEFVPETPPLSFNFPARNRIISGISMGVIVIEAGEKSGSLITADFALEQGREVFAVPGNISSAYSKGTNKLIREGAKIVTCVEDILEELKNFISTNNSSKITNNLKREIPYCKLNSEERLIVELLRSEPLHIDALASKSEFSIQLINSLLIMLELNGIVEQTPGKIFKLRE